MLPIPDFFPGPKRQRRLPAGFSLIELLVVIGLAAVLAAGLLTLAPVLRDRLAVQRARAELMLLGQGLEAYRLHFGDYPRTENSAQFSEALRGRLNPMLAPVSSRSFIDEGRFTSDPGGEGGDPFIDPWQGPYRYRYLPATASDPADYLLFSQGPPGTPQGAAPEAHLRVGRSAGSVLGGR